MRQLPIPLFVLVLFATLASAEPRTGTAAIEELTLKASTLMKDEAAFNVLMPLTDGQTLKLPRGQATVAVKKSQVTFSFKDRKTGRARTIPVRVSKTGSKVGLPGMDAYGKEATLLILLHPRFGIPFVVNPRAGVAKMGRTRLILVDANLDWRGGQAYHDAVIVMEGRKVRVLPMLAQIPIGKRLFLEVTSADGRVLTWKEPETGLTADELDAVLRLNLYRVASGLPEMRLDAARTRACIKHCEYALKNRDEFEHRETPGRPGYTTEGDQAARAGCIGYGRTPEIFIEKCVATLYHRFPLLLCDVNSVGFAWRARFATMNPDVAEHFPEEPLVFPGPGQFDVGLRHCPDEAGVPWCSTAGYPITIRSRGIEHAKDVIARLTKGNKEVPCDVSWPGKPAIAEKPRNRTSILVLPRSHLRPFTRYDLEVSWTQPDGSKTLTWHFHTGAGRPME
jgi:hypothetical protein